MQQKTQIYLVPGFFGFKSLGSLNYFHRVSETLGEGLKRRGKEAEIIECCTQPTGSITRRANRLLDKIIQSGGLDADVIHLVGHSTGGLDIRLLLTPGVRLRQGDEEEVIGRKTASAVSISTPHFGTPLAGFFTTMQGRQILQLLTLMATTSAGRRGIYLIAKVLSSVTRLDDAIGLDNTFLDVMAKKVFQHITMDEQDPIWLFLKEVSMDQGAIIQLTPEGMHLFNAAVVERTSVRYSCVVTASPPPFAQPLKDFVSPMRACLCFIYAIMYKLVSREHMHYPYPSPAGKYLEILRRELPFDFDTTTNDAVVPAMSQIYGELLDVVAGDHLDVVGQFRMVDGNPLSDWLSSGAGFNEERFQATWDLVAAYIAES